ncbi:unnamed protein product, partial [Ectocarpus sp. 4 AP-2014]
GGGLVGIAEEREGHDLDGTVRRGGRAEKGRAITVVGSRAEIQRVGLRGLAGDAEVVAEQRRFLRGRAAETKQERKNSRDERGGRPDAGHHLPGRRPRLQRSTLLQRPGEHPELPAAAEPRLAIGNLAGRAGVHRGVLLGQAALLRGLGRDAAPLGPAGGDGADVGAVPRVRLRGLLRVRHVLA